jgi:ArsR family transcriptional regulator
MKKSPVPLFKALGDDVRLNIVRFLLSQEKRACICDLAAHIGKDQSVVFRHVKILESAGIITTNKVGKFLHCRVSDRRFVVALLQQAGKVGA